MPFPQFARLSGPDYVSPTGFGGFYPTYFPDLGILTVKVKVLWEWIDSDAANPWNDGSKAAFMRAFKSNVPRAWDGKWRFRCTAAGFNTCVAEPRFVIEDGTQGHHHLTVRVKNTRGQSALIVSDDGPYLQLHVSDNDEYDNLNPPSRLNPATLYGMSRGSVMTSERDKVEALLQAVQNITLTRTADGWEVSQASRGALTALADGLKRVGAKSPKFPLTIHATSGAPGKSDQLVAAVTRFLAARGVTPAVYPIVTDSQTTRAKFRMPFKGHKDSAVASIELADISDIDTAANWHFRYKVANHEFGHCLGLPDEYTEYPEGRLKNAHAEWVSLCGRARVTPNPYPVINTSIMSSGWITNACHYVTVWDALTDLTKVAPYNINKRDWVIERGSQRDVL
jgi:hypothetical protein